MRNLLILCLLVLVRPEPGRASCGLDQCPVDVAPDPPAAPRWDLTTTWEHTRFALAGIEGSYTQMTPRLVWAPHPRWRVGAVAPLVRLEGDGRPVEWGANNPSLLGRVTLWGRGSLEVRGGLQLELPWGEHDTGIAADHLEVLPYLEVAARRAPLPVVVQVGFRRSVGDDSPARPDPAKHAGHGAGTTPLLVDPHADREALARVSVGWPTAWTGRTFVGAQRVLRGEAEGDNFVSLGSSLEIPAGPSIRLVPLAETTLTARERFSWRWGLALTITS